MIIVIMITMVTMILSKLMTIIKMTNTITNIKVFKVNIT